MSKKQERIKYLVGIYNALSVSESGDDGRLSYSRDAIKSVLETVKHLLAEDGIRGVSASDKVEDSSK